jgi:hypothetical protein
LAKGGWYEKFVPEQFMMIYSPQDDEGLDIIIEIIKAAAGWISVEESPENRATSTTLKA